MQTLTDFEQGDGKLLPLDGPAMRRGASWVDEAAHGHDGQARVTVWGIGLKRAKRGPVPGFLVRCTGCLLSWVTQP
jgi:hypothetical protein